MAFHSARFRIPSPHLKLHTRIQKKINKNKTFFCEGDKAKRSSCACVHMKVVSSVQVGSFAALTFCINSRRCVSVRKFNYSQSQIQFTSSVPLCLCLLYNFRVMSIDWHNFRSCKQLFLVPASVVSMHCIRSEKFYVEVCFSMRKFYGLD